MATRIPTYCEHCGHVWEGNEIVIGGNANITMKGNKTQCPSCRKMTPMLDGNFIVEGGVLKLEDGPQITLDKLEKIKAILSSVNESTSIEEVGKEIDSIAEQEGFFRKTKNWIEKNGASTIRTVTDIARLVDFLSRLF